MGEAHRGQARALPELQGARLGYPGWTEAERSTRAKESEGPEMKRFSTILFAAVSLSINVYAQGGSDQSSGTSAVPGGQFEVAQSPIVARDTFKLDRVTGRIWRLVRDEEKNTLWEAMRVRDLPAIASSLRTPRFQLFMSGIVARDTLLLDCSTGATWLLTDIIDAAGKTLRSEWMPVPII